MTDQLPGDVNLTLDLDALERPAKDVKPPFTVKVGDRVLTMQDPEELDWQDLLDLQHPIDFLQYVLSDDDRQHLMNQNMPGWKLSKLMDKYTKHFDIDKKMREAEREQRRLQG